MPREFLRNRCLLCGEGGIEYPKTGLVAFVGCKRAKTLCRRSRYVYCICASLAYATTTNCTVLLAK